MYIPFRPSEVFLGVVFKQATGTIMQHSPINISCNISYFITNLFFNQIVCIDAKCTCFAHSMLHLAVMTSNILKCLI